jgi:hypothetical protein
MLSLVRRKRPVVKSQIDRADVPYFSAIDLEGAGYPAVGDHFVKFPQRNTDIHRRFIMRSRMTIGRESLAGQRSVIRRRKEERG